MQEKAECYGRLKGLSEFIDKTELGGPLPAFDTDQNKALGYCIRVQYVKTSADLLHNGHGICLRLIELVSSTSKLDE